VESRHFVHIPLSPPVPKLSHHWRDNHLKTRLKNVMNDAKSHWKNVFHAVLKECFGTLFLCPLNVNRSTLNEKSLIFLHISEKSINFAAKMYFA